MSSRVPLSILCWCIDATVSLHLRLRAPDPMSRVYCVNIQEACQNEFRHVVWAQAPTNTLDTLGNLLLDTINYYNTFPSSLNPLEPLGDRRH
jgi:hypothetical protein